MIRCLNCMEIFDEVYGVCPHCGFIPGSPPKEAYHLFPGTVLRGRYIVGTTVGFGGFGITYRAWDKTLDKMVAIKEFYPNGLVNRVPGEKTVIIYSGNRANEFENGKIRFLAEARNMAMFNTHPNIVNVYEFFEENNTAYIAMEFLKGMSFKQYIAAQGGKIGWQTAVSVVLSVLDGLKEIHRAKIIHRDVSPDNIFLVPTDDGKDYRIKLIDFGAARFASGEEEKTLSIILKPGYAPPEQYRSKSRQGPWTDLYAVGAVLYRAITGIMPEESVNRMVEDHLKPPIEIVPEVPQYLSDSIMRAMALNQELRFQNVDQFREAIQNKAKVRSVSGELKRRKTIRGVSIAGICLVVLAASAVCVQIYRGKQQALYNIEAQLTVSMPDLNGEKEEQVQAAGVLGSEGETQDGRAYELVSSDDMLAQMLKEYQGSFQKVEVEAGRCVSREAYGEALSEEISSGSLPSVFESTGIGPEDKELWEALGSLEAAYEAVDEKEYYFLGDEAFQEAFGQEKKQMPVSFSAPVLYVNTYLMPEDAIPDDIRSVDQLVDGDGKISYCVSSREREMYREAFGVSQEELSKAEYAPFEETEREDAFGYEPFLRRETVYYLGSTDDYEAVRASLGGIYKMVVLTGLQEEGKVKGRFTHLWSINGSLEGQAKQAADNLVYYLLGESAQDVFNLQNGNGLSLNKNMMETYVDGNDEFQEILDHLDSLQMEYGSEERS